MKRQIPVALGAGLASALLFAAWAKGTVAAALFAYFTALPILIAALSFGHLSGLAGAGLGAGAVAIGLGWSPALLFALCFALPGWWLGYLAQLARPGAGATPGSVGALLWYPVGRLVTWAAALSAVGILALGAVALVRYGGFEEATRALALRLDTALEAAPAPSASALFFVRIMPPAAAASFFLMLCLNLWLAARVARLSQRLTRPWPNVADGLRLPQPAAVLFVATLVGAALGGLTGTVSGVVATTLGLAFALQGLGAAHVLTRGFGGRGAILALIYIVTIVVPVAVIALCLIGLVDCLFSLRDRRPPATPKPRHTQGD